MSNFCPVIWPEEPTPKYLQSCSKCGLDEHGTRMIWGEGNPDAPIMVILDNPGTREDRNGNPYVCGTRQTLQKAANHVGLDMGDLYVTFILKRKPVRAYDKEIVRQTCMIHLYHQLQTKQPNFILCLGNTAVQSIFQNPDTDVKTLRGATHYVNSYRTAVAYHPLAVRRRPNLWPLFAEEWKYVADNFKNK